MKDTVPMKDIAPYTEEEAQHLGRALIRLGCPSFGPAVGMDLLKVVEGVDKILQRRDLSPEMREVLFSLRTRFTDVCAIGAAMQGEVIEKAQRLFQ